MKTIAVCETFCSIQGEGVLAGVPSFFIRLSGCNLRCVWCDTPQASRPEAPAQALAIDVLLEMIRQHSNVRDVVITGGEPLLCAGLPRLTERVAAAGRRITLETNATLPPGSIVCDLASLSPKLPGTQPDGRDAIVWESLDAWCSAYTCQIKFVVGSDRDVAAALSVIDRLAQPPPSERILLMPRAATESAQAAIAPWLSAVCRATGLRYGHRLQLALFGNGKGT